MRRSTLIFASLRHFRFTHASVLAGSAVGAAALVGALLVGSSVRGSLKQLALERIQRVDAFLAAGDRQVTSELAERMERHLDASADATVAPLLQLPGSAALANGTARANGVQVLGIEERFLELLDDRASFELPGPSEAVLSHALAERLTAAPGDTVVLRLQTPSAIPQDMVLSDSANLSQALRLTVRSVLPEHGAGRFHLRADPSPALNCFVSLPFLQQQMELPGRANLLLLRGARDRDAQAALKEEWTLADGELQVRSIADRPMAELLSSRIFLEDSVLEAARKCSAPMISVLTYFVNELRVGDRSVPYSMVSALGTLEGAAERSAAPGLQFESILPPDLEDDEVVINDWLAEELSAAPGDVLELKYFVLRTSRTLVEESATLRVRAVVPMSGLAADPSLMPDFPGISGSAHCRDWEPGIPLDLDKIRDQDEQYWEQHRGTPKAFVSLAAGRRLWKNRFGEATALRVPIAAAQELEQTLRRELQPEQLGLRVEDVRGKALAASQSPTDFGGLFLGLSFFLILAALLLTALLFVLGIEQRTTEIGTLQAVGWPDRLVSRVLLSEGLILALMGSIAGAVLGVLYTKLVLFGLTSFWSSAVGGLELSLYLSPGIMFGGALATALAAWLAMLLTLRSLKRRPTLELLLGFHGATPLVRAAAARRSRQSLWIGLSCLGIAVVGSVAGITVPGIAGVTALPALFFSLGTLLLIACLFLCRSWIWSRALPSNAALRSVIDLGLRNSVRRPARSLSTIFLLSAGTFLVMAVGMNRLSPERNALERSSGTGGFALVASTAIPLLHDLNTARGRQEFALKDEELRDVTIVPLRVRDGEEASCLNLNRAQTPRLLGVRPELLESRGAFSFTGDGRWSALQQSVGSDAVNAIGDSASLTWALHKKLGDSLEMQDERGQPLRLVLAAALRGSILQGDLLISEDQFEARFPSNAGHRRFLIDCPPERAFEVSKTLTRALSDLGFEAVPTTQRLAELMSVQNTYLLIFQALGALGLVLGCSGLFVVIFRNVLERRTELAMLEAAGLSPTLVRRLVLAEHWALLVLGLCSGIVAAVAAVLPALFERGLDRSVLSNLIIGIAVAFCGGLSVLWSTRVALRGDLVEHLRGE